MNIHDLVTEQFGLFVEHFGTSDELYSLNCEHLGKNSVVAFFTTIICLGSPTDGGRTGCFTPTAQYFSFSTTPGSSRALNTEECESL